MELLIISLDEYYDFKELVERRKPTHQTYQDYIMMLARIGAVEMELSYLRKEETKWKEV